MRLTKWISSIIILLLFTFSFTTLAYAGWVKGYWKNGNYVSGYYRSNPNGLKYDNYSFDGDWSDAFNDSYYSSSRDYSSDWYTPSWTTQDDYWLGKSFYERRKSYKQYTPTYNNNYDLEDSYEYQPRTYYNNNDDYYRRKNYLGNSYNQYDNYNSFDNNYNRYDNYNSYDSYDNYNSYDNGW